MRTTRDIIHILKWRALTTTAQVLTAEILVLLNGNSKLSFTEEWLNLPNPSQNLLVNTASAHDFEFQPIADDNRIQTGI